MATVSGFPYTCSGIIKKTFESKRYGFILVTRPSSLKGEDVRFQYDVFEIEPKYQKLLITGLPVMLDKSESIQASKNFCPYDAVRAVPLHRMEFHATMVQKRRNEIVVKLEEINYLAVLDPPPESDFEVTEADLLWVRLTWYEMTKAFDESRRPHVEFLKKTPSRERSKSAPRCARSSSTGDMDSKKQKPSGPALLPGLVKVVTPLFGLVGCGKKDYPFEIKHVEPPPKFNKDDLTKFYCVGDVVTCLIDNNSLRLMYQPNRNAPPEDDESEEKEFEEDEGDDRDRSPDERPSRSRQRVGPKQRRGKSQGAAQPHRGMAPGCGSRCVHDSAPLHYHAPHIPTHHCSGCPHHSHFFHANPVMSSFLPMELKRIVDRVVERTRCSR